APKEYGLTGLPARLGSSSRSAATAVASAAAAAAACRFRARFVDGQVPASQLKFVQFLDSLLRFFVGTHFDEGEAAGPASHLIAHDADSFHRSGATKQILEICFADLIWQVTHVQLSTHDSDSSVAVRRSPTAGLDVEWMSSRS